MSNCKSYILVPGKDDFYHQFGGMEWDMEACTLCKSDIHQIVTLDLADDRLEAFRNPASGMLPLVSCLNCSASWWRQGYVISNNKITWSYQDIEEPEVMIEEDQIPSPLPKVPMHLEEYDDRDKEKFWEEFGEKFICKVGGDPVWAAEEIELECPDCGHKMKFAAMICGEQNTASKHVIDGVSLGLGTNVYYYAVCPDCGAITVDCQERTI